MSKDKATGSVKGDRYLERVSKGQDMYLRFFALAELNDLARCRQELGAAGPRGASSGVQA